MKLPLTPQKDNSGSFNANGMSMSPPHGDIEKEGNQPVGDQLDYQDPQGLQIQNSPEVEKSLVKKLDRRLVSLVFGLCKLTYIKSLYLTNIPRSSRLP